MSGTPPELYRLGLPRVNPGRRALCERLLAHVRREVPDAASDPALFDPAMRLIFQALAAELFEVYERVDESTERAFRALVHRLIAVPRGPRPAESVVRLMAAAGGREVDHNVVLECKTTRAGEGGKPEDVALHFRLRDRSWVGEYEVVAQALLAASGDVSLSVPAPAGSTDSRPRTFEGRAPRPDRPLLLFAVEQRVATPHDESPLLFVTGDDRTARRALWGRWFPWHGDTTARGNWSPASFVPPELSSGDLSALTFQTDRRAASGHYAARFIRLPLARSESVQAPALPGDLASHLPPASGRRWWWAIELAGDPSGPLDDVRILTDCVAMENRHIAQKVENVPDLQTQAVTLPVGFDGLVAVDEVTDLTTGATFWPAERVDSADRPHVFLLRTAADGHSVAVWMRNPQRRAVSARIQIRWSTCEGELANGLRPGSITRFSEPQAGLRFAENVVPTAGGRRARPVEGVEEELRGALRHHGRAVAQQDFCDLASALGSPFVRRVKAAAGVILTEDGARRCVRVEADVVPGSFVSSLEAEAVRAEIERVLGARAPAGLPVTVRLVEEADET